MLTKKALTQNTTATYCSTSNTIFVHSTKLKSKNVNSNNVQRVIRNVTQQQLAAYMQLPHTYLQQAKRFPLQLAAQLKTIIYN
jgi:TPP-dependent 2-oxoacid decarboxylase